MEKSKLEEREIMYRVEGYFKYIKICIIIEMRRYCIIEIIRGSYKKE